MFVGSRFDLSFFTFIYFLGCYMLDSCSSSCHFLDIFFSALILLGNCFKAIILEGNQPLCCYNVIMYLSRLCFLLLFLDSHFSICYFKCQNLQAVTFVAGSHFLHVPILALTFKLLFLQSLISLCSQSYVWTVIIQTVVFYAGIVKLSSLQQVAILTFPLFRQFFRQPIQSCSFFRQVFLYAANALKLPSYS